MSRVNWSEKRAVNSKKGTRDGRKEYTRHTLLSEKWEDGGKERLDSCLKTGSREKKAREKTIFLITIKKVFGGTSLVVQWLRICLPKWGTWVHSLAGKLRSQFPCATRQPSLCVATGKPMHHTTEPMCRNEDTAPQKRKKASHWCLPGTVTFQG